MVRTGELVRSGEAVQVIDKSVVSVARRPVVSSPAWLAWRPRSSPYRGPHLPARSVRGVRVVAQALLVGVVAAGCAPLFRAPAPPPPPGVVALPAIPFQDGPLALDVVYPAEGQRLTVRDSNFIFGSTGTGLAALRIDGTPVDVAPNGAFLAFLPVPADGVYRLEARVGEAAITLDRRVELPPPAPVLPPGEAVIVAGTVFPRGAWAVMPGERIEVGFRGSPGGRATLHLPDGRVLPLAERRPSSGAPPAAPAPPPGVPVAAPPGTPAPPSPGAPPAAPAPPPGVPVAAPPAPAPPLPTIASYRGYFNASPLVAVEGGLTPPALAPLVRRPDEVRDEIARRIGAAEAAGDFAAARAAAVGLDPTSPVATGEAPAAPLVAFIQLVVGSDTARAPLPLHLSLLDPDRPPVATAFEPEPFPASEGRVRGSPGPGFTFTYFWPNGTELTLTGERDGQYRVRLAPELHAWVDARSVYLQPAGRPPPGGRIGSVRVASLAHWVDVRLPMARRMPFKIVTAEDRVEIEVYGGTGDTDRLIHQDDPFLNHITWTQAADGLYRMTIHLNRAPWGHMAYWDGDALLVRVRRPPEIDPRHPLRGLVIALDPGHPPGGATGPTGLTEAQSVLAIANRLRLMLEREGARVVMTRTDDAPVGLYERVQTAEQAGAHLFISIHNDAFPDGVNPFVNLGSSTYYYHTHQSDLARALLGEILAELNTRDRGVGRASLAVVRRTDWMPAALTENLFMMIPEHEAALRDPRVQQRIAEAHLRGIERFLRARIGN